MFLKKGLPLMTHFPKLQTQLASWMPWHLGTCLQSREKAHSFGGMAALLDLFSASSTALQAMVVEAARMSKSMM